MNGIDNHEKNIFWTAWPFSMKGAAAISLLDIEMSCFYSARSHFKNWDVSPTRRSIEAQIEAFVGRGTKGKNPQFRLSFKFESVRLSVCLSAAAAFQTQKVWLIQNFSVKNFFLTWHGKKKRERCFLRWKKLGVGHFASKWSFLFFSCWKKLFISINGPASNFHFCC